MHVLLIVGSGFLGYLLSMEKDAPKYIKSKAIQLYDALEKALDEERYEDAASYRDKLKELA